ncbi:MAG: peptide ABC transporter permease [Chloroflexi bacterium]|nr:peptide ABC transporter permease [Chloroflexota bacterium]
MTTNKGYNTNEVRQARGSGYRIYTQFSRMLKKNPNMIIGFLILIIFTSMTIFADFISKYDPTAIDPSHRFMSPGATHWFGADVVGRDVYTRVIYGGRVSLLVGFMVAIFVTVAGLFIGLVSGYTPKLDIVIQRIMDALMSFPTLLLALALIAMLGGSVWNVIAVITIVDTPRMVRIVRSAVLSVREQQYVDAARGIGAPVQRILFMHIAPNTMAPVIVQATYFFAAAILTEASLSFLGLGIPPEDPSWGNILALGRKYLQQAFWIAFFPGLILTINVLAMNLVGDGLRDALDPKLSRSS